MAMKGKLMFNKSLYVRRLAVINYIEKSLYVFSIYTSSDGMKSAQMASYHGLSYDNPCNDGFGKPHFI